MEINAVTEKISGMLLGTTEVPVRMLTRDELFSADDSLHRHDGYEIRLVLNPEGNAVIRMDVIRPEVCHCNLPQSEWHCGHILFLKDAQMRITHRGRHYGTLRSPYFPALLTVLDHLDPHPSLTALREYRLLMALLYLRSDAVCEVRDYGRASAMVHYLQDNYYRHDLSIAAAARENGYSPNYIQQVFRAETGLTPVAYLMKIRMAAAARFLAEKRYLVKEVAMLCGISNAHFFAGIFRKYYHCTPTEFMASAKVDELKMLY